MSRITPILAVAALLSAAPMAVGQPPFQPMDVFQLEFAADPQIAPAGARVVYVRTSMDVMKDQVAWFEKYRTSAGN